jgi:hypothetical protein
MSRSRISRLWVRKFSRRQIRHGVSIAFSAYAAFEIKLKAGQPCVPTRLSQSSATIESDRRREDKLTSAGELPLQPLGSGSALLYRRMRRALARIGFLRSGYYLLLAISEALRDSPERGQAELDWEFAAREDPWSYATDSCHLSRIRREIELLDSVRCKKRFEKVLEIGCAEGLFTEKLAPLCDFLHAVDISTVALARARHNMTAVDSLCSRAICLHEGRAILE